MGDLVKRLTDKQLLVAYLVSLGLPEKEIAELLSCSRISVAHTKRNAAFKLGLDAHRRLAPQFGYLRDLLEAELRSRQVREADYARVD